MNALTAAHKSLPFGTKVKVTNPQTGRSVTVRINDRGPYHGNRTIDLSRATAASIGMVNAGVAKVQMEIL